MEPKARFRVMPLERASLRMQGICHHWGNGAPEGRGTPKSNSSCALFFNGLGARVFREVDLQVA